MGSTVRPGERGERRILVADADARIDAFIASTDTTLTRARVQRLIDEGFVWLNGEPVRKSARVTGGDRVEYEVPPEPGPPSTEGLEIPVLFEDSCLVVIDKPHGIPTHGGSGDSGPTIADWFADRYLDGIRTAFDDPTRAGVVHRLDKDTTGALVLARSPDVGSALSLAFENRQVEKTYVAITDGIPRRDRAMIDAPIGRHPGDRTKMAVLSTGRPARTRYEVVQALRERAFLEIGLETGRTHQVRVHLSAIGAPVMGDATYGRSTAPRHMLHAWKLALPHPDGGVLTVVAPLPPDIRAVVADLGFDTAAMPYCEAIEASYDPATIPQAQSTDSEN